MTSFLRPSALFSVALFAFGCAAQEQPKTTANDPAPAAPQAAAPCPCQQQNATANCGNCPGRGMGLRQGMGPRGGGRGMGRGLGGGMGAGACGMGQGMGPQGGMGMGPQGGMGMGPGMGMGRGPGGGGGIGPGIAACNVGSTPLDAATEKAVVRALQDEWQAQATYQAARTQLMSVRLANVVRMEERHAQALTYVLETHGNAVPARPSFTPPKLGDAKAVCKLGVDAEKKNIALYDELMKQSLPDDVKCVFLHLQQVSKERHLPAFEQCSS